MDVLSFSVCKCHFSSAHQGDKWGVGYSKSSFLDKVLAGLFQEEGGLPFLPPTQTQGEGDTALVWEKQGNLGLNNVQIVAICCENLIEVSSKNKSWHTLFALLLFLCLLFLAKTHLTYIYWRLCQYLLNKWSREATF